MEAAFAPSASAAASVEDSEVPVSWETTEDAIAAMLSDGSNLVEEFTNRFNSGLALTPDRALASFDDIGDEDTGSYHSDSPAGPGDSDTASTSSSIKDVDDTSNSPSANSSHGKAKTIITVGKTSPSPSLQSKQSEQEKLENKQTKSDSEPTQNTSDSLQSANQKDNHSLWKNGTSSNSYKSNGSTLKPSNSTKSSERRSSNDSRRSSDAKISISKQPESTSSGSNSKNPLKLLRRLTKSDKSKKKGDDFRSEFSEVVIDRLPQVFVAKYLGHRPVGGVCGLHHVRRPVDQMIKEVKDKLAENPKTELPLLYVVVSPKGVDLREHKSNKVKDVAPLGLLPIDFLSYGVQDIKFWRVFTCIVVDKMSSQARTRRARCHAFLCDSAYNGRKMALALGAAFNVYSKKLHNAGRENNFTVELRPPDELADELEQDV